MTVTVDPDCPSRPCKTNERNVHPTRIGLLSGSVRERSCNRFALVETQRPPHHQEMLRPKAWQEFDNAVGMHSSADDGCTVNAMADQPQIPDIA